MGIESAAYPSHGLAERMAKLGGADGGWRSQR